MKTRQKIEAITSNKELHPSQLPQKIWELVQDELMAFAKWLKKNGYQYSDHKKIWWKWDELSLTDAELLTIYENREK